MKAIIKTIAKILRGQRGFTLVEMVTVVAIMGVMAAVAVPMVNSQLGKARDKSYLQDKALIQTAVDSFFTAADNTRHQGQRQFPILGSTLSSGNDLTSSLTRDTVLTSFTTGSGTFEILTTIPLNPLRGTGGGEPKWRDGNADGQRQSEDNLNDRDATVANDISKGGGWYVDDVTFQGSTFAVDSRDYFIDFSLLVGQNLIANVPESASPDNGGGTISGSYSWYIKATGEVESLFFHFPDNDVDFGETEPTDAELDSRGFVDGVYP